MNNGSTAEKISSEDSKAGSPGEDRTADGKDKPSKKKWFNLNARGSDKKLSEKDT